MSVSSLPILGVVRPRVNASLQAAVALICAASAGVHAGLVPEHYEEAGLPLAAALTVSAVALGLCAVLARRPDRLAQAVVVVVLLGVAGCYVLSRTSGLPPLIDEPEELDLLGMVTTAAEVVAALVTLLPRNREEIR